MPAHTALAPGRAPAPAISIRSTGQPPGFGLLQGRRQCHGLLDSEQFTPRGSIRAVRRTPKDAEVRDSDSPSCCTRLREALMIFSATAGAHSPGAPPSGRPAATQAPATNNRAVDWWPGGRMKGWPTGAGMDGSFSPRCSMSSIGMPPAGPHQAPMDHAISSWADGNAGSRGPARPGRTAGAGAAG